eukprot:31629_1
MAVLFLRVALLFVATLSLCHAQLRDLPNCHQVAPNFNFRWAVDSSNALLHIRLEGRGRQVSEDTYLAIGVPRTARVMTDSDVQVAYVNGEGRPSVDDYYTGTDRFRCNGQTGVCPDTVLNGGSGINNNFDVSGSYVDDVLQISFSRPIDLAGNDFDGNLDRSFVLRRPMDFVWAMGTIGPGPYIAQHDDRGFFQVQLDRPGAQDNCQQFVAPPPSPPPVNPVRPVQLGKFERGDHGVSGEVFAVDQHTLRIDNFSYDGTGPDAYFWVGTGDNLNNGFKTPGFAEGRPDNCRVEKVGATIISAIMLRTEQPAELSDLVTVIVWQRYMKQKDAKELFIKTASEYSYGGR